ncbi:MAG: N-acetylneuraminate synthase family protein [Nitrosopumilus sp.]|nr:N-acetylneuraminate synthase family protein [Nitrosopumilus sp.]
MSLFEGIENCAIIAEVAQAHDGSLGMAHAFIDAAADSGADGIKFQTHIAAAESTPDEPWRVKFSQQDKTRYDYWKRMKFSEEQWAGLRDHARQRGLLFVSSPFSGEAVDLLERIDIDAWKIASGEVGNLPLFEQLAGHKKPVLLSTGMSPWSEIDTAVEQIRSHGLPVAVMQCTSIYPTPPEKTGITLIPKMRERYGCPVGLSDHSGTIYPGLAAAVYGIKVLELHVTFDRKMFGPDVPASVTFQELGQLIEGVRAIEAMMASEIDKDSMAEELGELRQIFNKSITAAIDLSAGIILASDHVALKKPGTGIPAARMGEIIGKRLKVGVSKDTILREEDLE